MDLFPIKTNSASWVAAGIALLANFALWFVFAVVLAKGVSVGWHL